MMSEPNRKIKRDGIALVVVLGMLSLLIILVVAFSGLMRVERSVASNVMRETQLQYGGLGAVQWIMYDINKSAVWSASNFPTSIYSTNASTVKMTTNYCDFKIVDSASGGYYFINQEARLALGIEGGSGDFHPSPWYLLTTNYTDEGILFSFLILNESGFFDVNALNTNFNYEAFGIDDPVALVDDKNKGNSRRLYNASEVRRYVESEVGGKNDAFTSYNPFKQVYFSSSTGGIWSSRINVNTSGVAAIKACFDDLTLAASADAVANVTDYMDEDSLVTDGMLRPSGEAVPMINEIGVQTVVTRQSAGLGQQYTIEPILLTEVWYPFLNSSLTTNAMGSTNYFIVHAAITSVSFSVVGATVPSYTENAESNVLDMSWSGNQFVVASNSSCSITYTTNGTPPATIGDLVMHFAPYVTYSNELDGSTVVDRVPAMSITNTIVALGGSGTVTVTNPVVAYEVVDPRYNWAVSQWQGAVTPTLDPPAENMAYTAVADGRFPAFVANSPIQHVGELGLIDDGTGSGSFIPVGVVAGVSSNYALLRRMTAHAEEYPRGLVHLNADEDFLLSALMAKNQNISAHLFETNGPVYVTKAYLTNVVYGMAMSAPHTSRADLATLITNRWVLANSSDFFDITGNSFTVLIAVKLFRDRSNVGKQGNPDHKYDGPGIDPDLAKKFLIAQFWRDPVSKEVQLKFVKWQRRKDS